MEPDNSLSLAQRNTQQGAIERAVLYGNLKQLTEVERLQYNFALCKSLGLNPLSRPIDYLELQGKLTVYINAIGVAQLRAIHGISTKIITKEQNKEFYSVTVIASDRTGRSEESTAVLSLCDRYGKELKGQDKANQFMKAETKAKRRATLALVGVPWADGDNIQKSSSYDPPVDLLPEEEF